jgi:pyrroloquinoline quinone (PQQ) biosynthesis protein C
LQELPQRFAAQLLNHPFLARCRAGTITAGELRRFLVQHGKYGAYFTRYLCALMSQLESGKDVVKLSANLLEELGIGAQPTTPHALLYADMLREFDIDTDSEPTYPETQNLIDTMFMLCRQSGGLAGLGALCLAGEAIVPTMYAQILDGFRCNCVPESRLKFFSIHVQCDDGHADTMLAIIDKMTAGSTTRQATIAFAGQIALLARLQFFDALLVEPS